MSILVPILGTLCLVEAAVIVVLVRGHIWSDRKTSLKTTDSGHHYPNYIAKLAANADENKA